MRSRYVQNSSYRYSVTWAFELIHSQYESIDSVMTQLRDGYGYQHRDKYYGYIRSSSSFAYKDCTQYST